MISQAGWWTQTPSATPLQKEMKCSFLYYVQLLMISQAGRWTQTPSAIPLQPKKWNAHFYFTFNIWCWPDWSMDLNPIHHLPPAKKWNAHFSNTFNLWWSVKLVDGLKPHLPHLSYQKNEMLIFRLCPTSNVGQTGQWTQTPSTTPVQPQKWNASFLDYVQLLVISQVCRWTWTPSTTCLQPKNEMLIFWFC